MKELIFTIGLFFLNILSFAQDTAAYKIQKAENKFVYSENTVKVFVGQKIHISTKNSSGKLEGLKLIDTVQSQILDYSKLMTYVLVQNNGLSICINYNIVQDPNGKSQTVLIVNNPYKKSLSYKAKFFSRKQNEYIETSINDVMPGISGIELWPYPITDFILYDFTVKE